MKRLIERTAAKWGAGELGKGLAFGASWMLFFRGYVILVALLTTFFLTRTLGAAEYGAYAYALSWILLFASPAILGSDVLLIRELANAAKRGQVERGRGALRFAHLGTVVMSALFVTLLAGIVVVLFRYVHKVDGVMFGAVLVALPLIPLYAFVRMRSSILLAFEKRGWSQFPELFLMPSLFLVFLVVHYFLPFERSADAAMALHIAAALATLVVVWRMSAAQIPVAIRRAVPKMETKRWLLSGLTIMAIAGIKVINQRVDILMVGSLLGAEPAGVYSIANRGATIVLQVSMALWTALMPTVAGLAAERDFARMGRLVRKVSLITTIVAAIPTIGLLVCAKWFLMIFGPEFIAGEPALLVMTMAQFLVTALGPVYVVLLLNGFERLAAVGAGVSVILNVVLNALLIPKFGLVGAAIALTIGQSTAAILMNVMIARKLGITALPVWVTREKR